MSVQKTDSIRSALEKEVTDTAAAKLYLLLAEDEIRSRPDSFLAHIQKAITFADRSRFTKALAVAYGDLGTFHSEKGDLKKADEWLHKSLQLHIQCGNADGETQIYANLGFLNLKMGNTKAALNYNQKCYDRGVAAKSKKAMAFSMNNLGQVYHHQGDFRNSIACYESAMRLFKDLGEAQGLAYTYNNLASIYFEQGDTAGSRKFCEKSLEMRKQLGDKKGIATAMNNLAYYYLRSGQEETTLRYFNEAMKLFSEMNDKIGMANQLNNIGALYSRKGELDRALKNYSAALQLTEESGYKQGIVSSLIRIGFISFKQKKFDQALELGQKARRMSEDLGMPAELKSCAEHLYHTYKAKGDHLNALENYELFIKMRDSINNESTRKASIKSQLKYEYEKQAAADSVAHAKESEIKNAELQKQKAEIKAKKNQQYALFGGLALVIIFAGFMYNRFKITQKQKGIIEEQKAIVEEQKQLVEEKQKEVMDSIRYAQRIQKAHLPNVNYIEKCLERLAKF